MWITSGRYQQTEYNSKLKSWHLHDCSSLDLVTSHFDKETIIQLTVKLRRFSVDAKDTSGARRSGKYLLHIKPNPCPTGTHTRHKGSREALTSPQPQVGPARPRTGAWKTHELSTALPVLGVSTVHNNRVDNWQTDFTEEDTNTEPIFPLRIPAQKIKSTRTTRIMNR